MRITERVKHTALWVGAIAVVAVILWIDIVSGFWQDLVILAGLAAGLVSFLLTVFVLDKILMRSAAKRWASVNRLAFTEFLHALADEEASEISRGEIVTRLLPQFNGLSAHDDETLHELRELVVTEHRLLADLLSRWAQFLASSGENEEILLHIADIALAFDKVRDASLEVESRRDDTSLAGLRQEIDQCNTSLEALTDELRQRLAAGD